MDKKIRKEIVNYYLLQKTKCIKIMEKRILISRRAMILANCFSRAFRTFVILQEKNIATTLFDEKIQS